LEIKEEQASKIMSRVHTLGYLLAVFLLIVLVSGCQTKQPEVSQPQYTTTPVSRGDVIGTVYAPGELVLADAVELSSPLNSKLVDLLVKPGGKVNKGDVLAHLDKSPFEKAYQDAVDKAQTELESANRNLKSAENSLEQVEYDVKQAEYNIRQAERNRRSAEYAVHQAENNRKEAEYNLRQAQYNLSAAQYDYDWASSQNSTTPTQLYRLGLAVQTATEAVYAARDRVTSAGAAIPIAQDRVQAAAEAVDIANEGVAAANSKAESARQEVDAARSKVNLAKNVLKLAQEDTAILDASEIRGPSDSVVMDIKLKRGDKVIKDSPIIVLADLTHLEMKVTVGQDSIMTIKPGMMADISLDALPGTTLKGSVDYVVPTKSTSSNTATYEIYLSFNDSTEGLLPGMSGGATILTAEKHEVLRVVRRLVKLAPDGSGQVEVLEQGQVVTKKVAIGVKGDSYYEILSGLNEGDLVVQRGRS
jgi:HlyD family secretion protein